MENASKALIMAAGVLIGVLIISLAVYIFVDFGTTSAKINKENAQQKILQFNSQFTSYIDKDLTIYDIVTILGYAQENNKYYKDNLNEQIKVSLDGKDITKKSDTEKSNLIKGEPLKDGKLPIYKLKEENIEYNDETGKVKQIKFIKQ